MKSLFLSNLVGHATDVCGRPYSSSFFGDCIVVNLMLHICQPSSVLEIFHLVMIEMLGVWYWLLLLWWFHLWGDINFLAMSLFWWCHFSGDITFLVMSLFWWCHCCGDVTRELKQCQAMDMRAAVICFGAQGAERDGGVHTCNFSAPETKVSCPRVDVQVMHRLKWSSKPLKRDSDAVMSHLFVSILLLPFSSCSTPREPWCSEGRSRLDSVDFLACQQHNLAKLHRMGIWISRSLDPNWQVHISTTTY